MNFIRLVPENLSKYSRYLLNDSFTMHKICFQKMYKIVKKYDYVIIKNHYL